MEYGDEACFPSRWVFAVMAFFSVALNYVLRVDINLALVAMVNHTALDLMDAEARGNASGLGNFTTSGTVCPLPWFPSDIVGPGAAGDQPVNASDVPPIDLSDEKLDGPFVWRQSTQTVIMSSFFIGYIWTQLFGGRIAEHFGGKEVIACGMISAAILHFLIPFAAGTSINLLIAQRILSGLSLGFIVPTANVMISKWCPPAERSMMNAVVHSGAHFGTVIAMPLTGILLGALGWEAVFYLIGSLGVLLFIAWKFLVHESPALHPSISRAELKNIRDAIGNERHGEKMPVPWKEMLRSAPFWAIVIAVFGNSWGFSIVISLLPTYLNNMQHFSVSENGFISALPYLCQFATSIPISVGVDYLRRHRFASVTTLRKVCHTIGQFGAGSMLLLLTVNGCNSDGVIIILAMYGAIQGFNLSGYSANMLDIAPNFAGTITGIVHIGYNIVSIVGPITAGNLLSGQQTLEQWAVIFRISAGCFFVAAFLYALLASGEEQPWNRPRSATSSESSWLVYSTDKNDYTGEILQKPVGGSSLTSAPISMRQPEPREDAPAVAAMSHELLFEAIRQQSYYTTL